MAEHGGVRTNINDFMWGFGNRCKKGTANAEDAVMGDTRRRSGSHPFDIGGRDTFPGLAILNVCLDWKWKADFRWLRISVLDSWVVQPSMVWMLMVAINGRIWLWWFWWLCEVARKIDKKKDNCKKEKKKKSFNNCVIIV